MNDNDPSQASAPALTRWHIAIDTRDVIAVAGAALVLAGAYAFDWKAAAGVTGLALCGLAWRLSR